MGEPCPELLVMAVPSEAVGVTRTGISYRVEQSPSPLRSHCRPEEDRMVGGGDLGDTVCEFNLPPFQENSHPLLN